MNQYEVLYAVKDDNKENLLFAAVGEAPHPWQGWSLESIRVCAYNMSDVQKAFYRKVEAVDDRECVFVKAQFIRKLQYTQQMVVAVRVNPNPNGWRIRTFSIKTDSDSFGGSNMYDLLYQEVKKKYPSITTNDFVLLEREQEAHVIIED